MAYINVNDWSCEQVIEWIKGIECINNFYIKSFFNNQVDGSQLLNISNSELTELGVVKIGHQEIILESIDHLKNFHFNLERENLQNLALQLATVTTSLYKKLSYDPESKLETNVLSDVARTVTKVKALISWLDRYPFHGHTQYNEIRSQMLRLALEIATVGQRDRFAQNPVKQITVLSEKLSKLANYIIQDISDPMILQPAYLELLTIKKKESELGFYVMPSFQFIHRITDVKFNSPAHNSGKVEDGDEIVQINYQTVVGWNFKKVLLLLQEPNVLLTLKKRPRHSNRIYGQLGLIKLPSKKRTIPSYPSPRIEQPPVMIDTIPELIPEQPKVIKVIKDTVSEAEESSENESDIMTPTDIKSLDSELLYLPKPRGILQRRHTICGDNMINYKSIGNFVLWHERKSSNLDGGSLRDKSISISFGLNTRPSTSLGLLNNSSKIETFKKSSTIVTDRKAFNTIHENDAETDEEHSLKTGVSKVLRIDPNIQQEYNQDSEYTCQVQETIIESFTPIPYADDDNTDQKNISQKHSLAPSEQKNFNKQKLQSNSPNVTEAINDVVINRELIRRGRLDKSFSTPAYDNVLTESNFDIPPRRQNIIPPVPPRKQVMAALASKQENLTTDPKLKNCMDIASNGLKTLNLPSSTQHSLTVSQNVDTEQETPNNKTREVSELIMSNKIKTLTNKKKNSLMAKRRKISLKTLGSNAAATIQGHLYRRAKDKSEVAYWTKMYFILMDIALYGYRRKESQKADCAIFLCGFTVAPAKEVHSKEFAFKVYHPKKTFYFAAETSEAMTQWIEYIRLATLKGTVNLECDAKDLYSETEWCSDDDLDTSFQKHLNTSSPATSHSMNSTVSGNEQTPPLQKSHYFGSLKKTFGRYSTSSNELQDNRFLGIFSTNKSTEKKSTDIVPTAQFKTYRKVVNNGGLQLGATSMIHTNISDSYSPSYYGINSNSLFLNLSNSSNMTQQQEESIESKACVLEITNDKEPTQSLRKTHNFLHASNPNLLDFNFQHAVDFPALNTSNCNWDHSNQQTGMTLLDLMLQQRAEEMKDMYDKRVDQGMERIDEKNMQKNIEKQVIKPNEDVHVDKKLLEIQKRCLPTPPDYAQSFKPNDQAILYTRSKEGLKLRDFGYELISNDDDVVRKEQSHQQDVKINDGRMSIPKRKVVPLSGSIKKKSGFTWMISHEKDDNQQSSSQSCSGSFRKGKFVGSTAITDESKLLKAKKHTFNSQHELQTISKVLRKNSAPTQGGNPVNIPYFSKLPFSSVNEKKLLGSPKLHRAIFGRNNNTNSASSTDHEIFSSITFPKV